MNIILSQNNLANYFAIADSTSSWYSAPTNTFNFVDNKSKTLLVTIGDSWTWGSDLSLIDNIRVDYVYGNILAKNIGADWLNLALCASGNFWLTEKAEELGKIIPSLGYDNIYVICLFTEVGRWFNTKYDLHINYRDWFKNNTNYFDLLAMLNQECVERILKALDKFPNVTIKFGTHFVNPIGMDIVKKENMIPKMWINTLGYDPTDEVYAIMYGIEPLTQALEFIPESDQTLYKQWILDLFRKAESRLTILKDPKNFVNCHPQVEAHKIWAKYLESIL